MFIVREKKLRKEKNLSQIELADILNVNRTTVGKRESGEHERNFSTLIKIKDFFDVSLDYLLGKKNIKKVTFKR